jgi:hypothetical protein
MEIFAPACRSELFEPRVNGAIAAVLGLFRDLFLATAIFSSLATAFLACCGAACPIWYFSQIGQWLRRNAT